MGIPIDVGGEHAMDMALGVVMEVVSVWCLGALGFGLYCPLHLLDR